MRVLISLLVTLMAMGCGDAGTDGTGGMSGTGATDGGGGGMIDPDEPTTAFRVTRLVLADPSFGAVSSTVNDTISGLVEGDDDEDGLFDLSLVILMNPFSTEVPGDNATRLVGADCALPGDGQSCSADTTDATVLTAVNQTEGDCLVPDAAVIFNPVEPVSTVSAGASGCFATGAQEYVLQLGTLPVPLEAGRIAAQYSTTLVNKAEDSETPADLTGVLSGFLRRSVARETIIPESVGPPLGGQPLNILFGLSGANGLDELEDGTKGWWVHANFEANLIAWDE